MSVGEASPLRLTPQRRAVLEVLAAAVDHPTAAEVFQRVRRRLPGIGPATVYRTLGLLVASGQARELALGDGASARYDANVSRHDHIVCVQCGTAVDVDARLPNQTIRSLAAATGYAIEDYDLQFRGQCPSCAAIPRPTSAR